MTRPTREETFLVIAEAFAQRGTCPRAKVGAVIVNRGHIIAHGYNGAPAGLPHCGESTPDNPGNPQQTCEPSPGQGCTTAVHAEENAIAYAARVGVQCEGAALFCTHEPCLRCARLIIQAGIKSVTYMERYRNHDGPRLLRDAGILAGQYILGVEPFRA